MRVEILYLRATGTLNVVHSLEKLLFRHQQAGGAFKSFCCLGHGIAQEMTHRRRHDAGNLTRNGIGMTLAHRSVILRYNH